MNTFIALKSNGNKVQFIEGQTSMKGLNPLYEARYCTCDETTENISEIPDWDTAEEIGNLEALKADMITKINACTTNNKAAMMAILKTLKAVLSDLKD